MRKSKLVDDSDEKDSIFFDKICNITIILLGLLILYVLVNFILLVSFNTGVFSTRSLSYECNSYEEQISNTNKGSIKYYKDAIDDLYDSIIVSPVCIQGSIYEYFNSVNVQKPEMFTHFNNGFRTWNESGAIFNNPCFSTFLPNEIDSKETLIGKSSDKSGGFLSNLGVDAEYDSSSLYSIFHLEYGIKDACYSSKSDMIYYDGVIGHKKTSEYEAIKLPLSNESYSVYLIDGDIGSFSTDDFDEETALVELSPYTWQSYGKINGLANSFCYDLSDVIILNQFGFSESNHKVVEEFESDTNNKYFYVSEYSIIVIDEKSDFIILIGKHE